MTKYLVLEHADDKQRETFEAELAAATFATTSGRRSDVDARRARAAELTAFGLAAAGTVTIV